MRVNDIRNYASTTGFQPVRIYRSDEGSYDVDQPEKIWVTRYEVLIAHELGADGIPEEVVRCDPRHVTRIEPLREADAG